MLLGLFVCVAYCWRTEMEDPVLMVILGFIMLDALVIWLMAG
jgi:hypothetical protein